MPLGRVRTRRASGFTLIELTVVIAILALTATLVAPRILSIRETAETRTTLNKLAAAVGSARSLARSRGQDLVVGLDAEARDIALTSVPDAASANSNAPLGTSTNSAQPTEFATTISVGAFTVARVDRGDNPPPDAPQSPNGETLGVFYADGTASPATAEIQVNGRKDTLRVRADGSVTLTATTDAPADDPNAADLWKAGDLEVRTG